LCHKIATQAYKYSLTKKNYKSPFHLKALKANLHYPAMGKSDDITVVVAQV
jgi:hypothetical protein